MANNRRLPVTHDTTGFVSDRFAKIATTYTGGYTKVQYAASVCTNVKGTITLPAEMKAIADGTYKGADAETKERLAMSYINHEMGHDDVELRLKEDRRRRKKTRCSKALYEMVPPELKAIAFAPKSRIMLTSEWLKKLESYGSHIALAYGGSSRSATVQLKTLVNASEDPRQEALVGSRWVGSREYLAFGHQHSLAEWVKRAEELKSRGETCSFFIFAIGMVFELHNSAHPFGQEVQDQLDACRDLIDLYKNEGDWKTPHGYFDSINFSLACLGRVYRQEAAIEPPKPTCQNCGSENLRATKGRNTITIICCDCGHRDEQELEAGDTPDEDAGGSDDEKMGDPCDNGDKDEDGEPGGDSEGNESEGSDESEGNEDQSDTGENTGDEASDDGDSSEESGDSESDSEGENTGENDNDGAADSYKLEVGSIVRIKADGSIGRVTKLNSDGTIEVTPIE